MIDDYDMFRAAHEKDYSLLVEYLRSDHPLLPRHRKLLAAILEGKLTLPPRRQAKTLKVLRRKQAIAKRVDALTSDGWKQTAAIAQAASEFRCSGTTVKNALKHHRQGEETLALAKETTARINQLPEAERRERMAAFAGDLEEAITHIYSEVGLKVWRRPRIFSEGTNK